MLSFFLLTILDSHHLLFFPNNSNMNRKLTKAASKSITSLKKLQCQRN